MRSIPGSGRWEGRLRPGIGLIFSRHDGVIPDLIWAIPDQLPTILIDPATGRRDGKWHLAPALVVEVLSPGDRETKLTLYGRRGVREYWIVDPLNRAIEVYRRAESNLRLAATIRSDESLSSPMLPGFTLLVDELLVEIEP